MPKAWGNIGAWAEDAERAEAEEKEQAAAAAVATAVAPPQSYPSLKEAASSNKGKKKTKMTLHEFTMTGAGAGGFAGGSSRRELAFEYKGLTPEEMMLLPTGPKERSAEEMQHGRIGGGFSSYGGGRNGGGPRMRDREPDGNRRSYGGFDDDRRGPVSRNSDYDHISRADEVDNWAMTKKTPSFDSGTRPNRYSSVGGGGFSRADEIDNWGVNKKPIAIAPPHARSSNFTSGFRDSGGPEPHRWSTGVNQDRLTERQRLVLNPPNGENHSNEPVNKTNRPNPFGNARPREEILAEKGLDWKKTDLELEVKKPNSRPTSSHSNKSGNSGEVSVSLQGFEKPRSKVNPFGDAKPREVLLLEKGVDYRKIDLELERRRFSRLETEAEKKLKEEINNLKMDFKKESYKNQTSLHDTILTKERELEQLTRDLDDILRFGQRTVERPGSAAGRVNLGLGLGLGCKERPCSGSERMGLGFHERPPSQSGSLDESRSVDFFDRPRSRGEFGMRITYDRRGGFLGNREPGRPNSRDRW